ncbi:MAG: hypothetical protein QXK12_01315 [Candidatus Nezhaarchaeales archaeon]
MLIVWGLMLLLFVAIEKLVAPLELPFSSFYLALIKLFISMLLASAWLYLWNHMIKIYCKRSYA